MNGVYILFRGLFLFLLFCKVVPQRRPPTTKMPPTVANIETTATDIVATRESATTVTELETTSTKTATTTTIESSTTTPAVTTLITQPTTSASITDETNDISLLTNQDNEVWVIVYALIGVIGVILTAVVLAFVVHTARKKLKSARFELQHSLNLPDAIYYDPAITDPKPTSSGSMPDTSVDADMYHYYSEILPNGSVKSGKSRKIGTLKKDSDGYLEPCAVNSMMYETCIARDRQSHRYQTLSAEAIKDTKLLTTDV